MVCKDTLVGGDIDQEVKCPAELCQHRTPLQRPHKSEDLGKHQQTVTAVIELPDELKMLCAVHIRR